MSVDATMSTYQKIISDRLYSNNGRAKRQLRSAPLSPFHNFHQNKKHGPVKAFSDFLVEGGGCGTKHDIIRCHVWNPNHTLTVALCSSSNESSSFYICSISLGATTSWKVLHNLKGGHDRPITSLDWSNIGKLSFQNGNEDQGNSTNATNGRIVSCGEDCRAFVWSYNTSCQSWTPCTVLLQQQRSCLTPLCCKFDPTGVRFAIAMGGDNKSATLELCQYDKQEWISQPVGRHQIKSSLLCIDWHPCKDVRAQLVACGGCDYRCRIFSVSDPEQDGESSSAERNIPFQNILSFGEQYAEFNTDGGGWVTAVSWSPSGKSLAFSSQDSSIHIVSWNHQMIDPKISVVRLACLPFCNLLFCTEYDIIAGGYDGVPSLIKSTEREWSYKGTLINLSESNDSYFTEKKHGGVSLENNCSSISCMKCCTLAMKPDHGTKDKFHSDVCLSTTGYDCSFQFWTC